MAAAVPQDGQTFESETVMEHSETFESETFPDENTLKDGIAPAFESEEVCTQNLPAIGAKDTIWRTIFMTFDEPVPIHCSADACVVCGLY
eukprot:SAG11_NODE_129_length_15500_cov_16.145250_7_plen_90_part_00